MKFGIGLSYAPSDTIKCMTKEIKKDSSLSYYKVGDILLRVVLNCLSQALVIKIIFVDDILSAKFSTDL